MTPGASHHALTEDVFVFPASFAQQRLWFVEQLIPNRSLYTIPLVFWLTGSLHRAALERSIAAIAQRHETLRTTFRMVDGQLAQIIAPHADLSLGWTDLQTLAENTRKDAALEQIRQVAEQPFDLTTGPLCRAQAWQLGDTEHVLLIAFHHIIFDEWSGGVLIRELAALYTAFLHDQPHPLPELPIQYADFAHWQRQWLQGDALNAQLNYWRQQLHDLPTLELPTAAPRPEVPQHRGASQLLEVPQTLLEPLEALSQNVGATLFMTLLAAFQTLLHRYTGQTDMAIGSPIANRHRSELEGLIGFLVNSLVLRTNLAGDPSFRELLERVREVTLAAYAHQDLPFDKLVEELQPVRSLSQNPLFQVVFALQNAPMAQLELPGLTLNPLEFAAQTTRFDLEVYLWKAGDDFRNSWGKGWQQANGLRGIVVYNTDLFDGDAIARLRHHFHTLLTGIVANPDAPISTLPLLTPAEQQQQLMTWTKTRTQYPSHDCIHHLFEQQVRQRPVAIAVRYGDRHFTYEELNQGSNQLGRYLQKLGVRPEQPVGICLERSSEAIAAMLAVLKAGGAYVPLDPSHPSERLNFIVKDANISVVLTQRPWAEAFAEADVQVVCLDESWGAIVEQPDHNLSTPGKADQLAYLMYTSGSTGAPKGVMVPHRAIARLVCQTNYVHLGKSDRIAQVANLAFDAATFEIWGALLNGAQLVGIEREITLSPMEFAATLQQLRISVLFLTTALFNQTVSQVPRAFQTLKYLLFGGELANLDRVRTVVQQGKPQHLLHVYGPTENTTFSTWYEVKQVPEKATTIPIGRAIANTQVYVVDSHLKPVPPGACGEIYLGGDGLARGYLNQPELTAERFIQAEELGLDAEEPGISFQLKPSIPSPPSSILYKTGDRAFYRPDGNLEFLGRTDHQVKIRGFRVELGEIERVLAQHPGVQDVAVIVRDVEGDRQLIAYIVSKSEIDTERELRRYLKTKLPIYMVPAAFVALTALPLTPNGKVDSRALPLPMMTAKPVLSQAPTSSIEQDLEEIWSQLLGRGAISTDDNFFELGGHSLLATQLVSRIRDRFQVELSLRSLFETPTIAALAQKIEALKWAQATSMSSQRTTPTAHRREEIEL
ncbi:MULTISPECIES: non-ribosomal peptide synthetase [unclassified Leptolyngbya]|uniref:non-ribosomal peptide synthetase n=1 Tax=unclassified Leptolyngbya TaxID=2650499 RepID=UPI001689A32B|nr:MULTISPECIES: non-ribosomal peptide synthetase [unclassified Leptolyngbya]MBD1909938.1 amino acid adenylation domain-containing protein [Leptolyngbya sp. FACHB-8]MBD2154941.1 amino acid adenylation domain-containing protein [Leptolyngbya sp. FACHB-16]